MTEAAEKNLEMPAPMPRRLLMTDAERPLFSRANALSSAPPSSPAPPPPLAPRPPCGVKPEGGCVGAAADLGSYLSFCESLRPCLSCMSPLSTASGWHAAWHGAPHGVARRMAARHPSKRSCRRVPP
jgi:hypothetical protein